MTAVRARTFDFAVTLDEDWTAVSDRGGDALHHDEAAWTPEHLLLTALTRCSLTSLGYHARRAGVTATTRANASGTVTARPADGRFAFVRIDLAIDVHFDPRLDRDAVRTLLAKAERDCFVGASLALTPTYRWTVNGEEIS